MDVDQAVAPLVQTVHLKTCGSWGCHEQDVPLHISGPTSAMPCLSESAAPGAACGVAQLPGPGPGFGYAPVPPLTFDQVTVTVTTPPGAPFRISTEVLVRPSVVCPGQADQEDQPDQAGEPGQAGQPGSTAGSSARPTCPGATPQARLRIAADGTVSRSR